MSNVPMIFDKDKRTWERHLCETDRAFEAFQIYRNMKPKRNLGAVAEMMDLSPSTIQNWSSENRWKTRVVEYETHLDNLFLEEGDRATIAMHRRQIQTDLDMQNLVSNELRKLIEESGASEKPVMVMADLIKLANLAHSDERLNRSLPTEILRVEGANKSYSNLSLDELKTLRMLLDKANKKQEEE